LEKGARKSRGADPQMNSEEADSSRNRDYSGIIELLKGYTGHPGAALTRSGDAAIYVACFLAKLLRKKRMLIPDQGGWLTYKTYPLVFDLEVEEIHTTDALIDLNDLKKKADDTCAFIVPSMGGYFVEEPLESIGELSRKRGCLVIVDATAAVSDAVLCNGNDADIILGSFGKGKIIDAGYGGFISFREKEYRDRARELLALMKFDRDGFLPVVHEKLIHAQKRLSSFFSRSTQVKEDCRNRNLDVIHRGSRSVNVVIGFASEKEKNEILKYCHAKNLEYTLCPRYIRVMRSAVSIELKRGSIAL